MKGTLLGTVATGLLLVAITVGEARASGYHYGGGYGYGAGYGYGHTHVYAPAVVYRPVVVHRPVYVQPVAYHVVDPCCGPDEVRIDRGGRRVRTYDYTPYGRHETEYKYDRWGNLRDVDYDFDD